LDTPISNISRISLVYQKRLIKLGVKTLRDLFYHFPHRYQDLSEIKSIASLVAGETSTIQGQVSAIKNIRTWKKRINITEAHIQDETGQIRAIWYNQPFITNSLKEGDYVSLAGKVNINKGLYLSNPSYEKIDKNNLSFSIKSLRHTGKLVPIYSETAGLSSRYLRYIFQLLAPSLEQVTDWLPEETRNSQGLIRLNQALNQIHFPASNKTIISARQRLAFDELFLIQFYALWQKTKWQQEKSVKIPFNEALIKKFVKELPFALTESQRQSTWEILQDIGKSQPMNRLLEGDVGSGKTIVAALAALQTASAGYQVAFMAPTEVLASQHFKSLMKLFSQYNLALGLLTNTVSQTGCQAEIMDQNKKQLLGQIKNGQIKIIVGTHSLIQKSVRFKNLALAIIDEQHRFGVAQRAALLDGLPGSVPHLLSMTATPIPRTLALTIYGDLDVSLLKEMPRGRQAIITKIVGAQNRQKAYNFIRQQIVSGRQAFVICPRIETNDKKENDETVLKERRNFTLFKNNLSFAKDEEIKTVKQETAKLAKEIFPEFKIAALHSKLKPLEKNKIMADFKSGKINILVSTSVVEVGIDIPNASVMMIEGAERFGLAQLHQFRGRVGRGQHQSFCLLLTSGASQENNQRLKALLGAKNGFELAEQDLRLRGPGQFYGAKQWGLPDLSMASLTDLELIKQVRREAQKILQQDPELKKYPKLQEKLQTFKEKIHLE